MNTRVNVEQFDPERSYDLFTSQQQHGYLISYDDSTWFERTGVAAKYSDLGDYMFDMIFVMAAIYVAENRNITVLTHDQALKAVKQGDLFADVVFSGTVN